MTTRPSRKSNMKTPTPAVAREDPRRGVASGASGVRNTVGIDARIPLLHGDSAPYAAEDGRPQLMAGGRQGGKEIENDVEFRSGRVKDHVIHRPHRRRRGQEAAAGEVLSLDHLGQGGAEFAPDPESVPTPVGRGYGRSLFRRPDSGHVSDACYCEVETEAAAVGCEQRGQRNADGAPFHWRSQISQMPSAQRPTGSLGLADRGQAGRGSDVSPVGCQIGGTRSDARRSWRLAMT